MNRKSQTPKTADKTVEIRGFHEGDRIPCMVYCTPSQKDAKLAALESEGYSSLSARSITGEAI